MLTCAAKKGGSSRLCADASFRVRAKVQPKFPYLPLDSRLPTSSFGLNDVPLKKRRVVQHPVEAKRRQIERHVSAMDD